MWVRWEKNRYRIYIETYTGEVVWSLQDLLQNYTGKKIVGKKKARMKYTIPQIDKWVGYVGFHYTILFTFEIFHNEK